MEKQGRGRDFGRCRGREMKPVVGRKKEKRANNIRRQNQAGETKQKKWKRIEEKQGWHKGENFSCVYSFSFFPFPWRKVGSRSEGTEYPANPCRAGWADHGSAVC